ncbi:MAG: hypothetical protein AAGJ50_15025 [Pseudomonadota bacterium]
MTPPNAPVLQAFDVARSPAPLWEQGLVSLWFLVTFIPFENDELLLYPLALYFVASFVLHIRQLLPLVLRCWPLFLVPALAAFSMFWSPVSSLSLRFGIMMTLTALIAISIAGRLTPRQIVGSVFVACALSVFVAIPESGSLNDQEGLYVQKNIFAIRMTIAMVLALGVALDRGQHILFRLIALPFVPLTLYLILIAESATALLLSAAALVILGTIWLLWSNFERVRHLRVIVLGFAMVVALVGGLVVANAPTG